MWMSLHARYFEPGQLQFPCEDLRLRALIGLATSSQKVDVHDVKNRRL
jgi:hypothetical protein